MRTGVRVLILVIVGVQVLVPAFMLMAERPARFGWHMYAVPTHVEQVVIETADSEHDEVSALEFVGRYRPEVDYARYLPEHVCRVRDDAVTVTVLADEPNDVGSHRC